MAVDEALLEAAGRGVTTLRLYQWSEPTLSLGYFQAAGDRAGHAASRECPLVRRASGGGAIVHHRELTYCLAVPITARFDREADKLFSIVHAALTSALGELGVPAEQVAPQGGRPPSPRPFLCFQRRSPGDVLCNATKIAGSAQRRQRSGLAQHGSILLARSACGPELPGIEEASGISLTPDDLAGRLIDALAAGLGVHWQPGELTETETQRAATYQRARYAAEAWTFRR